MSEPANKSGEIKTVAVLEKALVILECMCDYPYGITLRKLSSKVNMNKSTVYRILHTLKLHGYISQNPISSEYRIDYKFMQFMSVFDNSDLKTIASPHMKQLAEVTKHTCSLVVLDRHEGIYIDSATPNDNVSIRIHINVGANIPLHCTAAGKVLLAGLEMQESKKVLEITGLPAYTSNTIVDLKKLYEELQTIQQQNYAYERFEYEENLCTIAAPIKNTRSVTYGAVCIHGTGLSITPYTQSAFSTLAYSSGKLISQAGGCPDYDTIAYRE
ncbi:IclR family transcriptional regulator [Ruminococcaceae bacterium OttesenSCG-928-D13]|nr:IclR family transcriptional regulator [Ruminococcaceae bacterium OttesenSCG-928-D13]